MFGRCPGCGMNWHTGDIPRKSWEYYEPPYKWSGLVYVKHLHEELDYYQCPKCKKRFELNEVE